MNFMDMPLEKIPRRQATFTCLHCGEAECICFRHDALSHSRDIVSIHDNNIYTAPISPVDKIRNKFVFKLENNQLRARFWLMSGGFDVYTALGIVIARLGRNDAADAAVKCISQDDDAAGQQAYVFALQTLRTVLYDRTLSTSPETLAAANILYNHETYLNPSGSSWTMHAGGLIQLLKYHGAHNIRSDLEKAILIGNIGSILTMATILREPCFLEQPDWISSLRGSIDRANEIQKGSFPEEVKNIILTIVYVSGLLSRHQRAVSSPGLDGLQELMEDISRLRTELQDCRRRYEKGPRWQSLEDEIAYALTDPMLATCQMTADILVLVANLMLLELRTRYRSPDHPGSANSSDKQFATVNQWTLLASQAKIKWLALKQLDANSARACAAFSNAAIRWVLELPCAGTAELQSIRLILQDLHNCLRP